MGTRIIINDKEITNPYIKALLILGAIIVGAAVAAVVIFVLLPIIGIAVTVSIGFVVVLLIAALVSVATLALVAVLAAWLFGAAEFRFEKSHRRKNGPDAYDD
jgi:membrane protein implicated in regulation of membrane protease activity